MEKLSFNVKKFMETPINNGYTSYVDDIPCLVCSFALCSPELMQTRIERLESHAVGMYGQDIVKYRDSVPHSLFLVAKSVTDPTLKEVLDSYEQRLWGLNGEEEGREQLKKDFIAVLKERDLVTFINEPIQLETPSPQVKVLQEVK